MFLFKIFILLQWRRLKEIGIFYNIGYKKYKKEKKTTRLGFSASLAPITLGVWQNNILLEIRIGS